MTVVVELEPEIEGRVGAAAAARGLTVDEYVRAIVGETVAKSSAREGSQLPLPLPAPPNPQFSPAERAAAWLEGGKIYPPDLPVLSDWAMSRDSICPDEY